MLAAKKAKLANPCVHAQSMHSVNAKKLHWLILIAIQCAFAGGTIVMVPTCTSHTGCGCVDLYKYLYSIVSVTAWPNSCTGTAGKWWQSTAAASGCESGEDKKSHCPRWRCPDRSTGCRCCRAAGCDCGPPRSTARMCCCRHCRRPRTALSSDTPVDRNTGSEWARCTVCSPEQTWGQGRAQFAVLNRPGVRVGHSL